MDPITAAIAAALTTGTAGVLTEVSKTAIDDAYQALKALLAKKFGPKSQVVQAVDHLEAKPESANRQGGLAEEMIAAQAHQDQEVLEAAEHLLALVQPQQAGFGKFTIQFNAPVQGPVIGNDNTITQQFGEPPKA